MKSARATVVLPTLEGEHELSELLPALRAQRELDGSPLSLQIAAVDSSSSDNTLALLEEHGAEVEVIERREFGHGRTRNQAAARARAPYLVFVSQDVLPADEHAIAHLLAAFEDERVAGAYSRVLPHPQDDPLTARTVLDLPESSEDGWVRDLDAVEGVWALDAETRARYLRFNNVASAIRTEVFRAIPFPEVAFAEDFAWASRALTAGHRIAYAPASRVFHAHSYSLAKAKERYQVDALFHYTAHGLRVRPNVLSALRGFAYEVLRDLRYLRRQSQRGRLGSALRSPALRAAQILGQYLGSHGVRPTTARADVVGSLHL